METTLYKVVRVKDRRYVSVCTSHIFALNYSYGGKTYLLIGKIFGFLEKEHAVSYLNYLKRYTRRAIL